MTDAPKYRVRLVRAHMDYITAEINDVDKMIENMIFSNPDFENAVQFLCTIPSVKRDSAITIISEIGTDMSQFGGFQTFYVAGLVLHQAAMNLLVRRNLFGLHVPVSTSNLH